MALGYVILSHRGNADKEGNMKLLQDVGMSIVKEADNLDGMTITTVGKGD